MRVTLIGKCPPLEGGVSRRTFDVACAIAALGHQVSFFTNAGAAAATYTAAYDDEDRRHFAAAVRGMRFASLGSAERIVHIPPSPAYETRLVGLAGEAAEQSDCVIGWYYQPYGVAAAILAQRFGRPCVLVHAGSDLGRLARVKDLQLAYRFLFAHAHLVALGPATEKLIAEQLALATRDRLIAVPRSPVYPPYFLTGAPQPLDLAHLRGYAEAHLAAWEIAPAEKESLLALNRKPFDAGAATIGVYGKIGEQKGNHDLLRALDALAARGRRFNFVLCGGGHPARIGAFLAQLLQSDALRARSWVFPFIAPWKVPGFIAACDLIAFLERDFPISFHSPRLPREVLAVGTALLCSREIADKQPFDDRLADRENYIDAGDPKDTAKLAAAIDFCLADRGRLKRIGAAGGALLAAYREREPQDPIIPALQNRGLL
jgi:glycosyltransferase involved in cell wall biosynthesis